ncbi:MAG: AAA family ATPase [Methylococcales bacterium]
MSFVEVVDQVTRLLRNQERISYRTLKREFSLDEEALEDLKEELIHAQRVARDEDEKVLIWTAGTRLTLSTAGASVETEAQSRASFTPTDLAERILTEQAAMKARGAVDGERKTITALFADLKGSTALIKGLDPEDARAIIDSVLQLMMDAVHRYDGYVAQVLGDGVFAMFGAPIAHEDHPPRALYAALEMQEEIRRQSDQSRLEGARALQMRVGINTGEVVVRSIRKEDLHTDYILVGYSTSLAARMEQRAAPGSIVVGEFTRKLTEGYFDLKALGTMEIEGYGEVLNIYEVVGTGPLRTRLQFVARRRLTRFVGRKSELSRIRRALAQAKIGRGQVVGMVGEPGLGKSRVFHEFKLTAQRGCRVLEAFSVSHGKAFPYLPLIEMLKDYFHLDRADDERTRKAKITRKIIILDRNLEEIIPYIFWMLGVESATSSLRQMDPQIRRRRKFEALNRLFLRESLNQPLLLIFEDLHWLDHGTRSFLELLSEGLTSANILVLVNYRPEYRHDWGNRTSFTQIRLGPLDKKESEEFLTCLLGTGESLAPLRPILLEKTEGTPFFLEEMVQTLSEEGVLAGERGRFRLLAAPLDLHISPTVQGVLAARIDRLRMEEKELLQQLAVIGRRFPFGLVKQVIPQPEDILRRVLSSLQAKEFLYEQPAFPEVWYHFKHTLTQELAYGSVLQKQRKVLHEKTARALETLYSENLDEHYGELAHHYSHGEDTEKAVMYLGLAGQQAAQRSAYADAIDYLNQAVALLLKLPNSPERSQQKLTFQITLVASLGASRGYGSLEVEQALVRARELCRNAEPVPELSPVLYALRRLYMARGDLQKADDLADQHLLLAQRIDATPVQLLAHVSRGIISSGMGDFRRASSHFDEDLLLYDARQHHALASLYGDDPGTVSCGYNALALWALGYPDQALARVRESLRLAEAFDHPLSLAWARLFAAILHQYRRESSLTLEHAEAVVALSHEQGFRLFLGAGTIARGWASADRAEPEAGIALIREGLATYQATGATNWHPYFLTLLSAACQKAGRSDEGLPFLDQALDEVERNGEHQHEAELYRLRGILTLTDGTQKSNAQAQEPVTGLIAGPINEKAEADFLRALAIARQQCAKSWELRAGTNLARLWPGQGKRAAALELLAPIHEWFTEGFDTADLKEARCLLYNLENA